MLQNSWSIKLSQPPRQITTALLPQPSFVFQGSSNQLLVHQKNETFPLPIRKQVIKLCNLPAQGQQCDQILLLTPYSLLCFNFLSNEQKFAVELQNAHEMILIDNNIYVLCLDSLYCFNRDGEQVYVNHFTEKITTICSRTNTKLKTQIQEQSQEHSFQIYIGFADMTLGRYIKQNLVYDFGKVAGTPISLVSIGKGVIVGTKQGVIAYYQTKKSKWKAKSSHPVKKVVKFQVDTSEHLIVMRQNGNIELKDWKNNGSTISKIKGGEPLIDSFIMDFRKQKFDQVICILQTGLIKAFNLISTSDPSNMPSKPIQQDFVVNRIGIEALQNKRADLQFEIQKLKQSLKANKQQEEEAEGPILQQNFSLQGTLQYQNGLILKVKTKNGFISGLTFEQAIMPVFVDRLEEFKYQFKQENEIAGSVTCQLLVHSSFSATKYEVRTIPILLPKFWKWGLTSQVKHKIEGKLRFRMIERNARYLKWAKQCFFINISQKQEQRLESLSVMRLRFNNFYQNRDMELIFAPNDGYVEILCDCLKTIGDIVQDLVNYVGVKDLNTELYLPGEKQKIKQDLATVERLSQTKISISTEMAQATNTIKFLLVKGESARLVGSMNSFRKSYAEIMQQNRNLLAEIVKKNMNTKTLGQTMKSVGQFINKIANIRYGKPKALIITKCRQAIKAKQFPEIIRLMDQGVQIDE